MYCVSFILVVIVYSLYLETKDSWKMVALALFDNILYYLLSIFLFAANNHSFWILAL